MPKGPIFIVEDDADISKLIGHYLEAAGFATVTFANAKLVVQEAERLLPSLFLLDIVVPGRNGFDLCWSIRKSTTLATTPVIFLSVKTSEADRILGLELGADDYVAKPFSPRELVARVKAVLRRCENPVPLLPIRIGEIKIDCSAMTLTVRGKHNATTATEFRLLEHFVRNQGRVFTRDNILDAVWRNDRDVTTRSVDVYVRRVREKIERDPGNPVYLTTVRGAGYRFDYAGR